MIIIKTIDHKDQRYETIGDWVIDPRGNVNITVSRMSDRRFEILVALHEFIEVALCKHNGITQKEVEEFDHGFELLRTLHPEIIGDMEPGSMSSAPYFKEHTFATNIERMMADELGVSWNEYERETNNL